MDPRTGGYIGEAPVSLSMMAVQQAHAWGVPSLGGGSLSSDAADVGWQSGIVHHLIPFINDMILTGNSGLR